MRRVLDVSGQRAAQGTVDEAFLAELLLDPYYVQPAPKSTGKEYFHLDYLLEHLEQRTIAPNDLLATLTALSAETVANAVKDLGVKELFASGGGTRNPVLMEEIRRRLPGVAVSLVDDFGIDESAKEAALMALIGFLTVQGLPATVASCTGAKRSQILGAVIPGRQQVTALDATHQPHAIVFPANANTGLDALVTMPASFDSRPTRGAFLVVAGQPKLFVASALDVAAGEKVAHRWRERFGQDPDNAVGDAALADAAARGTRCEVLFDGEDVQKMDKHRLRAVRGWRDRDGLSGSHEFAQPLASG